MILLIAFAFLAGVITVLSPCILPILPIILTSSIGGVNTGKSRPIGVVIGFILSFTFFTLFLSTIVRVSGIPAETMRLVSVFVIAGFGISLLVPQFQVLVERLFSRFSGLMPSSQGKTGFGGGLLIGFSVGLLWTPCVGPILASVISLAITGAVTFDAFLITLAYSLGTAIPMFLIMLGGQNVLRRIPWLLSNLGHIQKLFGVLMILTAVGIFFNVDRKFQTFMLNTFPQNGTGLTKLEDNELILNQLDERSSSTNKKSGIEIKKEDMGKPMFDLEPKGAPSIPQIVNRQASFAIFTNGTFRVFTATMYHNLSPDVFIEGSNPNVIQIKKDGLTWNDFFSTLPFKLTHECLTTGTGQTFCTGSNGTLKFYINGEKAVNVLDQQINNGDKLLVTFGNETELEIKEQYDRIPF